MAKPLSWLLLSGLLALPAPLWALRCGTDLISVGDHYSEVLRLCGPPTFAEEWVEHRRYRKYYYDHLPYYSDVYGAVPIKEWTYNLGPTHFMRLLRFEHGKLTRIRTLDYGY